MVIREVLQLLIQKLQENKIENAIFDAHCMVRHVLNMEAIDLVLRKNDVVKEKDCNALLRMAERRIKQEPLQYILGTQEFMSLYFDVSPSVLIPRADTETLVEHILNCYTKKGFLALEIGVGSGCIGISLAKHNSRAYVRGIDISDDALKVAQGNAKKHKVDDRVIFEKCDVFTGDIVGRYDVIVSNPPYIETDIIKDLDKNVQSFEPHLALDGGIDGLDFYRKIVSIAPKLLNEKGFLAFEIGHTQGQAVADLMKEDFTDIKIIKDLCKMNRVVSGVKK